MVADGFKTHGSYSDFGYLSQEAGDNIIKDSIYISSHL